MRDSNRTARTTHSESYCARCLTPVDPREHRCPGCSTSFFGTGRFDLLGGPRPSREFAHLFRVDRRV